MSVEAIPAAITQQAQEMSEAIGLLPTIEHIVAHRWRITFSNDRVTVTVDYRVSPRFEWVDSTLTIDGKPRRLANGLEQLARFFNDTTAVLAELYVPVIVPDNAKLSEAPAFVRHIYAIFSARARMRGDLEVRATRTERNGWCVGIYLEKRLVEFSFIRRNRKWVGDIQPLRLIIDNEDISDEVDNFEQALMRLFSGSNEQPQGRRPIGQTRQVQGRATSVQVRRTAVIRN